MAENTQVDIREPGRIKKLIEVWFWHTNQTRIDYCNDCRSTYKNRPPCGECEWKEPELLTENLDAWDLWLNCSTQWRTNGGLDYTEARNIAGDLGIDWDKELLMKIQVLEKEVLKKRKSNAGRE